MNDQDALRPGEPGAQRSLAVTLSGGGHRATLFGLGALMYFADAEANKRVTSIASVSGGSLTNGFVGQTLDFRHAGGKTFRKDVAAPLANQIAKSGTLFAPLFTKLYLTALIVGLLVVVATLAGATLAGATLVAVPGRPYAWLLAFFVGVMLWCWLFGQRGRVCAHAFQKTLFSPGGRATPLRAVDKKELDHVICATELRASQQVFFSGDFIYSYQLGHGRPADLALARAVQASASFPGGFPAARLSTRRHDFAGVPTHGGGPPKPPARMVLTDGGVYDNMGDEWARGFADRVKVWQDLGKGRQAPNQLVVVNASARVPWQPFRGGLIPLIGEVALLLRVNNVMYINTTNVRRQEIVSSYDPDHPDKASGLPGALVQISQSPFRVADTYAGGTGPVAERAKEVIAMLGEKTRGEWKRIAEENASVATSLNALGVEVSARLIRQGYVVTMCNLYVIFGGDFPLLPAEVVFERYLNLMS